MSLQSQKIRWVWLAIAAAGIASAGLLHAPLDELSEKYELEPIDKGTIERYPQLALLQTAPGGLRAIAVNYLWIRSQDFKEQGRFYDAMQLATTICYLQPRFEGVWAFNSWNMAWNISVATHTPEERWQWVYNGVKLLRDDGIPMNRRSLLLYKELAWIFFFKMGQYTDDMHMVYKQRWGGEMQDLLSSPPYGGTKDVIDAFRPIAAAPLDKDIRRQGLEEIQPDMRDQLLSDAELADYAGKLQAVGVGVDRSLLDAYNRVSMAPDAYLYRLDVPKQETDEEKTLFELINGSAYAAQRTKLLAFVRAQILWNKYKMDPAWMLDLMVRLDAPLDWRHVYSHSLYWVTYGIHVCDSLGMSDIIALNTDRIVLNSLKEMTWTGRLILTRNPRNPDMPDLRWLADFRFVEPTQTEYMRIINAIASSKAADDEKNDFESGHINYLATAIAGLYADYQRDEAQKYFDWIKSYYRKTGEEWDMPLGDFVAYRLNKEGSPIRDIADSQITAALRTWLRLTAANQPDEARQSLQYAMMVYDIYAKNVTADRMKQAEFLSILSSVAAEVLIRPETLGFHIPLADRSRVYRMLNENVQTLIYDSIDIYLRPLCDEQNYDFDKAFPMPESLKKYREKLHERIKVEKNK